MDAGFVKPDARITAESHQRQFVVLSDPAYQWSTSAISCPSAMSRQGLKYQLPLVGLVECRSGLSSRPDLKAPPTAVGGIFEFVQSSR